MPASHDRRITEANFIRKLKRPDGCAVWPAYRAGEDRFGTWLFTPKGSLHRGEKAGAGCARVAWVVRVSPVAVAARMVMAAASVMAPRAPAGFRRALVARPLAPKPAPI